MPTEPAPGDTQAILTILATADTPLSYVQVRAAIIGPGKHGPITRERRQWFTRDMQLMHAFIDLEGAGLIRQCGGGGRDDPLYKLARPQPPGPINHL
jgi:hypothetical protein